MFSALAGGFSLPRVLRPFWRSPTTRSAGPSKPTRSRRRRVLRWLVVALIGYDVLWGLANGGILLASRYASMRTPTPAVPADLRTLGHLQAVDGHLWRSAAPSTAAQYEALRRAGVTTVVDLRQLGPGATRSEADRLGRFHLRSVLIPVPDGGVPAPSQVQAFLGVVATARGLVLVHCGAGVGRTGTMVAAYLVATHQANGRQAMMRNLSVGPPSIEQLAFELDMGEGRSYGPPDPAVRVVSRAMDEPRLLLNALRHG